MVQGKSKSINQHLSEIADMTLLNGTLTECMGLIHGKIGIAIYFFYYAQYTGNMLFADYAMDLIEKTQSQIHLDSPSDYEKGLAGIGVGIDYLVRNKYLIVDDDVCEDFDYRMYRAVMSDPWQSFGLYDGLVGYGKYWITRLCHQTPAKYAQECLMYIIKQIKKNFPFIPVEEQNDVYCFLYDLKEISGFESSIDILKLCERWDLSSFIRLGHSVTGNIGRIFQHNYYFNNSLKGDPEIDLSLISDINKNKSPVSMGLLNGYAGEGLLRLSFLHQMNRSWILLL